MKRPFLQHPRYSGARLARRLDHAAHRMNPYLVVVAVGLVILNITFLIGLRVSPPRPGGVGAPVELTAVQ